MDSAWVVVGTVVSIHGLSGELVVRTPGDNPEGLSRYKSLCWFSLDGTEKTMNVASMRIHKGMALLSLDGVNCREDAEEFIGGTFKVQRKDLAPLDEGVYYIVDLVGLNVETTDGRSIGPVRDVLQTGANDVYVLDFDGREVLIPAIDSVVRSVDIKGGRIVIEAIEGLLD